MAGFAGSGAAPGFWLKTLISLGILASVRRGGVQRLRKKTGETVKE
jgi:hypothetical protein